jgi:hypothetical protein
VFAARRQAPVFADEKPLKRFISKPYRGILTG